MPARDKLVKVKHILNNERGSVVVLVALMFTALVASAALVVDVGRAYAEKESLQNAVDAAALAGAQDIPDPARAYSTALQYALANGLKASEVTITIPYDGHNDQIEVKARREVHFALASVLGYESREVECRAVATTSTGGVARCFDYAIFSELNLNWNGGQREIFGNVHTNQNANINGSNHQVIHGVLEACGNINLNPRNPSSIPCPVPGAGYVPMPSWEINDLYSRRTQYYEGNQNWNGTTVTLDGIVFVHGSVNLNGCKFRGKGSLVVTGDVNVNGGGFDYEGPEDGVCIYTLGNFNKNGGGDYKIVGAIYAPNGAVNLNGNKIDITGCIVCHQINLNGGTTTVNYDPKALETIPVKDGPKGSRLIV